MSETKMDRRAADELIYKLQYRRKLNPAFIPLTKIGFVATGGFLYYFYGSGVGPVSAILFLAVFRYIYNNKFNYRYYEIESIWVVSRLVGFLSERRKRTIPDHKIDYDVTARIKQPPELII